MTYYSELHNNRPMRTKNGLAPQWALVPIGARGAADDTIDIIQVFVRTMREKGVCNERYSERLGNKPPPGAGSATSLRQAPGAGRTLCTIREMGVCNVAAPPAQGAQIAAQAHLNVVSQIVKQRLLSCCIYSYNLIIMFNLNILQDQLWRPRKRKAHPLTLLDGTRKHAHPPNRSARGRSPARPTNSL